MKNKLKLQLRTYADTYKVRWSATRKLLSICEAENKLLLSEVKRQIKRRKEDVERLRGWHEGIAGMRDAISELRAERDKLKRMVHRLSGPPAFLDESLNSGDGSYRP